MDEFRQAGADKKKGILCRKFYSKEIPLRMREEAGSGMMTQAEGIPHWLWDGLDTMSQGNTAF